MELSQDVGYRPIIFIRFNPDNYKTNLKNITSCWGLNKKGWNCCFIFLYSFINIYLPL